MKQISVLFIDDEPSNLLVLKSTYRRDYQIFTAESAKEAKEILKTTEIHLIVSDHKMPVQSGVEFFEEIRLQYPLAVRILLTGYTDRDIVVDAINKGKIFKYLEKPWKIEEMTQSLKEGIDYHNEQKAKLNEISELKTLAEQLEFIARQNTLS